MTRSQKALTLDEQKRLILAPYIDMLEEGDPDGVAQLIVHAGIIMVGSDVEAAILAHYKKRDGSYDIEAAAHDLRRFPPIAARIWALKEVNP